mgnify:CR=1 FL=1
MNNEFELSAFVSGAILAVIVAISTGCSFRVETGWHGQTGRDDRVISPTLYPDDVDQRRDVKQRY